MNQYCLRKRESRRQAKVTNTDTHRYDDWHTTKGITTTGECVKGGGLEASPNEDLVPSIHQLQG